ncbi:hypothetical protein [Pseudomonas sp. NPDC089401]|uniref:hypothetical protein n=1 Tax=Pseudomonas sp. NPDC089401 TaxID=3364462 RepID=UPI00381A4B7E
MANNQDKGTTNPQAGKTGQQGGHGSGGDMAGKHKGGEQSGRMPEDKMNKDWDATRDTAGRQGENARDKQTPDKSGAMGGKPASDHQQHKDKDR